MKTTVAVTSKGQFTLPSKVREELGLLRKGDTLQLDFDPSDRTVRLSKPVTFKELQKFVQSKSAKSTKLPDNIHEWYENERLKDLKNRGVL